MQKAINIIRKGVARIQMFGCISFSKIISPRRNKRNCTPNA
jgi:hypothetical protein